jgi:hypothetical protein
MANKVLLKKSSVAAKVPLTTDLDYGELALNYADGKLHYKKSNGSTIDHFPSAAVVATGYVAKTGDTMTGNLTISSTYPRINLTDTNNDSDYSIINSDGAFAVYDVTNAANRLVVTSTGNLGIGTSSPAAKLQVLSTSAGAIATQLLLSNPDNTDGTGAQLAFSGVAGGTVVTGAITNVRDASGSYSMRFATYGGGGSNERMRIDSSGNLGLGVTPSAWNAYKVLQIGGATALYTDTTGSEIATVQNAYYNSGWKYGVTGTPASWNLQYQGRTIWNTAPSGTAGSAISFTQAMTLDASGNLGIGTTSPSSKLDVVGNIRVNSINVFNGSSGVTTSTAQAVVALFAAATYGSGKFIIQATQGTVRHIIELLVVHDGTTAYATEYGMIRTGASLFTTDVDISAGNVRVLVTATSATSTAYKISQNLILA